MAPHSWTEIKEIIHRYRANCSRKNIETGPLLKRHPSVTEEYQIVKEDGRCSSAYVRHRVFDLEELRRGVSFRWNAFPYWVEPDVAHGVMWFNNDVFTEIPEKKIDVFLSGLPWRSVWYENEGPWKTVPGIMHVHVFVKINSDPKDYVLSSVQQSLKNSSLVTKSGPRKK